jgi:hypothetical protein
VDVTINREGHADLTGVVRGLAHADGEAWCDRVAQANRLLADHVRLTEDLPGRYAEVLDADPRLARDVRRLLREHAALTEAIAVLLNGDTQPTAARRRRLRDLARLWDRHRQRGADLLHAAYGLDLGGET